MTREIVIRLYVKLMFTLTGFIMMLGGCDELSDYLTTKQQRLLGAVVFVGFGWWLYRWLKWYVQHDLAYVRVYDAPIHFHEPLGQKQE